MHKTCSNCRSSNIFLETCRFGIHRNLTLYNESMNTQALKSNIPMIYLPTFPKSNAKDFRIHINRLPEKIPMTSEQCRRFQVFRRLPNITADVPMISEGSCPISQTETRHFGMLFRTQTTLSAVHWTIFGGN